MNPSWSLDAERGTPRETAPPSPPEVAIIATGVGDDGRGCKDDDSTPLSIPFRVIGAVGRWIEYSFGLLTLLVGLSVLATIPVVQFLSLGYLLEASARVARGGRLRESLIGVRKAARIGGFALGAWLVLLPLRYLSDLSYSAQLIAPDSGMAASWRIGLVVCVALGIAHVATAWYCGGRPIHFAWPLPLIMLVTGLSWAHQSDFFVALIVFSVPLLLGLTFRLALTTRLKVALVPMFHFLPTRLRHDLRNLTAATEWFPPAALWAGCRRGRGYRFTRDRALDFLAELRLPYYFSLGLRGFVGALAWLTVPVLLMVGATELPGKLTVLSGLLGVPLMAGVLLYLPFLQTHMAAENRLSAVFEIGRVRRMFRGAPIAFWFALLITLLFALPLYLLKIELTPRQVAWVPGLVFILFIFPARVLTGWSLRRARKRDRPRFFLSRWTARLAAVPVVAVFVFVLFFTRYTSWGGVWSLFEQHAFLLPVPFVNL